MPRLASEERLEIPSWTGGLEKNTPPVLNELGTIADGQNFVPLQAARLATRGGSRLLLTLHNDAGPEVTGLAGVFPWTSIGGLVIGYDTTQHKSYAWYVTQDMVLAGSNEANSRVDLSLEPSGTIVHQSWKDVGGAPIPQASELFEGLYLADATLSQSTRRYFLSLNQTVPVVQVGSANPNIKVPRFCFAGTGSGATAHSSLAGAPPSSVSSVTVDTGGTGYTSVPTVVLTGGGGAGATAHAVLTLGVVTSIVVDTAGSGYLTAPTVTILAGQAQEITPYCLETYNNVLFIAGYGDESAGNADRPEYLRHSFLGAAPSNSLALGDISDGFDKNAFALLGAKGQRITAMKQGRGYLLCAKANELYRVSGSGRAYPGFQYVVEMVMNTSGMGCSNPYALTFAEGYWYGMGAAGPFRTDGFKVEPMGGPRKADVLALDNLANSFTFYHPDRRLICFGVHPQGTSPSQYPWILWTWDIQRERWQPDWVFALPTAFAHGANVPTTSVPGPTAPPSLPVTLAQFVDGYTASWTTGDAAAQTELWELDTTGTWILALTLSPGITQATTTGRIDHSNYQWKVRHVKNGLYSTYTSPVAVKTLILPPLLSVQNIDINFFVQIVNVSRGVPVNYSLTQVGGPTYTGGPITFGASFLAPSNGPGSGETWTGFVTDPAWSPTTSTTTTLGPI